MDIIEIIALLVSFTLGFWLLKRNVKKQCSAALVKSVLAKHRRHIRNWNKEKHL